MCVCVRACACANHSAVSLFLALISGLKSQGCGTKEGKNAAGSAGSGKRRRHSAVSAAGGERSAEEWGGNGLEEAARGLLRQSIDRQRGALAEGGSGGGANFFFVCGRVLFGSRVAKQEAEGTVHTKRKVQVVGSLT